MPVPRKQQISLTDTPYYHCVSRCVRRAFLCGEDTFSGKSYEHRRQWVEDRILFLSTVFSIDVCAFAVMSNHTHVVLHVDEHQAKRWSEEEVCKRWHKLHKGTLLSQKFAASGSQALTPAQHFTLGDTLKVYRERLTSISWFMRELNEPIARQANKEDQCTGHFWEGRFKSQALLDEHALAACMVYVDLNPIRAKMAKTPETSEHTSIKRRIHDLKSGHQPKTLMPFVGDTRQAQPKGLSFALIDYINLVDLSGRAINPRKRGAIDVHESTILVRLGIDETLWSTLTCEFEAQFHGAAGSINALKVYRQNNKRRRLQVV